MYRPILEQVRTISSKTESSWQKAQSPLAFGAWQKKITIPSFGTHEYFEQQINKKILGNVQIVENKKDNNWKFEYLPYKKIYARSGVLFPCAQRDFAHAKNLLQKTKQQWGEHDPFYKLLKNFLEDFHMIIGGIQRQATIEDKIAAQ